MKIRFKKMLSVLLAMVMVLGTLAFSAFAEEEEEETAAPDDALTVTLDAEEEAPAEEAAAIDPAAKMVGVAEERIDEVEIAGRTCYMYVPASNRVGNILALTPIVVVFGDEAFTAETAMQYAQDYGFAEIAARDGLCVLFANPVESWDVETEEDAKALYFGIYNTYSSRPTVVFENGIGFDDWKNDGEGGNVYPGAIHGLQLYGEGKGADFIAKFYTMYNLYNAYYAEQRFDGLTSIPSGMALFCPNEVAEYAAEMQGEGFGATKLTKVIPMVIVNGPENAEDIAKAYLADGGKDLQDCYAVITDENVTGFDADIILSTYDDIVGKYYYSQGEYRDFPKYNLNGIIEVNDTKTVSSGANIEIYEYIPDDIDLSVEDSVPVFFWCHGFGGEGEAMLSWTEWPLVGKENGFMVVGIDQHVAYTADDCWEMIEQLVEEYPFIDETKIYFGGFSMGSMKTWQVGLSYYDKLAGIMPDAGVWTTGVDLEGVAEGALLPIFYIGGSKSSFDEVGMFEAAGSTVWKLNNIGEYEYDPNLGEWGQEATEIYQKRYAFNSDHVLPAASRPQILDVSIFESADGNAYTFLSVNRNRIHTVTNDDAWTVWEYMKNFSRVDGQIVIDAE